MSNIVKIYTIIHIFLLYSFRLSKKFDNTMHLFGQTEKVRLSMMYHLLYSDGIIANEDNLEYMNCFLEELWDRCLGVSYRLNQDFKFEFVKIWQFVEAALNHSEENYKTCLIDMVMYDSDLEFLKNNLMFMTEDQILYCPSNFVEYSQPFTLRCREEILEDWNFYVPMSPIENILSRSINIL